MLIDDVEHSTNQNINNNTILADGFKNFDDSSFHCPHLLSMDFKSLGLFLSFFYFHNIFRSISCTRFFG